MGSKDSLYIGQCRECDFKLGPGSYIATVDAANAHGEQTGHIVFVVWYSNIRDRVLGERVGV